MIHLQASLAEKKLKRVISAWQKVARLCVIYRRSLTRPKALRFAEWRYQTAKQAMRKRADLLMQNLSTRRCRYQLSTQAHLLFVARFDLRHLSYCAPECCWLYNMHVSCCFDSPYISLSTQKQPMLQHNIGCTCFLYCPACPNNPYNRQVCCSIRMLWCVIC